MGHKLTVENLEQLMSECIYSEAELRDVAGVPKGALKITGLARTFALHPVRTKERTSRVNEMLSELPDEFKKADGGGWSFLNMPKRKDGQLWGEQYQAEALMVLGLAVGSVKYCMPRDLWRSLEGGVPYIQVLC